MDRIFILVLVLLASSCKKADDRACIKGTGDQISEERSLPVFHSIQLHDFIDYDLIQDSTDKVVVSCGENLMSFVTTDVENGVLQIRDENTCHWLRALPVKIKVEIHFSQLESIRNESAGTLRTVGQMVQELIVFDNYHSAGKNYLDLKAEEATIRLSAGGPLCVVQGEVDHVNLRNSGGGKLQAENLIANSVWVDNKADGEIRLNVAGGPMWYLLDGYGDIYYQGQATQIVEVSYLGQGDLIELD